MPCGTGLQRHRWVRFVYGEPGAGVPFDHCDYAVVDLETTGLDPTADRVVEVAVVRSDHHGTVTDRWSTLVRPPVPVGATEVHGIDDRAVADAPRWEEITGELAERLEGAVLVAHHAAFEERFLAVESAAAGFPLGTHRALDTRTLAARCWPDADRLSLEALCRRAGITNRCPHRAEQDASATAELLAVLVRELRGRGHTGWVFPDRR